MKAKKDLKKKKRFCTLIYSQYSHTCMFFRNAGYAITCTKCTESTSDDPWFPLRVDFNEMTCSRNPGEMVCDEAVTSCWTTIITMHFSRGAGKNVMPFAHEAFFSIASLLYIIYFVKVLSILALYGVSFTWCAKDCVTVSLTQSLV